MSHPIEGLMTTAMESIKDMVDVNTIIGDAVQAPDGTVIIPVSKVSFGFAAGGGEYAKCCSTKAPSEEEDGYRTSSDKHPFAGGSGAGVSINPVGFMVVGKDQIRLMPIGMNTTVDKIIDLVPDLIKKFEELVCNKVHDKKKKCAEKDFVNDDSVEDNIDNS